MNWFSNVSSSWHFWVYPTWSWWIILLYIAGFTLLEFFKFLHLWSCLSGFGIRVMLVSELVKNYSFLFNFLKDFIKIGNFSLCLGELTSKGIQIWGFLCGNILNKYSNSISSVDRVLARLSVFFFSTSEPALGAIYLLIGHVARGILVAQPRIKPMPLHWKHRVLTTEPPGKALCISSWVCVTLSLKVLRPSPHT